MSLHKFFKEYEAEFVAGIFFSDVAIFLLELWRY
jgi:hypothetical protein